MPDIGWMELLVIGVVALIVVGPKDLPVMFRKFGQFTGKLRAMARDFQRAMNDAADEAGVSDINRDLRKATQYARNPAKAGMSALKDSLGEDFELDPSKYAEGSETRRIAEEKLANAKKLRDEIDARNKAKAASNAAAEVTAAPAANIGPAADAASTDTSKS
ncbi:twin-arginine translocase subunit TatB [Rhodobacterales bacterium LSUCC0031]|nr:twin-arginine translocase subunit TatB [Rhodobacterales bacterium LSUCC0031]